MTTQDAYDHHSEHNSETETTRKTWPDLIWLFTVRYGIGAVSAIIVVTAIYFISVKPNAEERAMLMKEMVLDRKASQTEVLAIVTEISRSTVAQHDLMKKQLEVIGATKSVVETTAQSLKIFSDKMIDLHPKQTRLLEENAEDHDKIEDMLNEIDFKLRGIQ